MAALPYSLQAVLFDLDGTLLNTAPDFITVLNQILIEEGKPALPPQLIRNTVSNGARALITLGFNIAPEAPEFERLRNRLLDLYSAQLLDQSALFPGMQHTLNFIARHGLQWGVVTNKPERFTQPIMQGLALQPAPGAIICPDHVERTKPYPDALLLACKQMGCDPARVIYVGDHLRDIQAGQNAGMPTIACAYGYIDEHDTAEQWGATHVIQHADELPTLLHNYLH